MKKNLISVVVNCYNGEKYLLKTLQSIKEQKYKKLEVIFIDNCSTDGSAKIFKNINDKRFKYYKTKKKVKLYKARNLALNKCRGDFITFLDTDDWWDKNFLSSRKSFFNSSKDYGFSYSNCFHHHENTNKTKIFSKIFFSSGFVTKNLLNDYIVKMGTIIIKKKIVKLYKFNENFNIIGDYDYILRISEKFKAKAFNDCLVTIRIHQNNFSHSNRKLFYNEFKCWIKSKNFSKINYKENKDKLFSKLEYLRLIYLLLENKTFGLILDIMRYPSLLYKLKLLLIYFTPLHLIKLKSKYF
jgi:glycosyltransferase involved in cell wall biosynthesis|tara:strand:+ start:1031 stop:1924 length:894 start_codon:yes stop_codon:yes gene_type:complete